MAARSLFSLKFGLVLLVVVALLSMTGVSCRVVSETDQVGVAADRTQDKFGNEKLFHRFTAALGTKPNWAERPESSPESSIQGAAGPETSPKKGARVKVGVALGPVSE
ncbi:unnamed protein product [Calypogeia fissa]